MRARTERRCAALRCAEELPLKVRFFRRFQTTLQTDEVKNVPCGTR